MDDLLSLVQKYLIERGWDHNDPPNIAKSIVIEGAELLEVFQWHHGSTEETKRDSQLMFLVNDELADVIIYCLEMAVNLGLDPVEIVKNKLAKSSLKYPAAKMKNDHSHANYWKIKNGHRKNLADREMVG